MSLFSWLKDWKVLNELKEKIKTSPNALDDYCFNQGVNAIESFAKHLLEAVEKLRA